MKVSASDRAAPVITNKSSATPTTTRLFQFRFIENLGCGDAAARFALKRDKRVFATRSTKKHKRHKKVVLRDHDLFVPLCAFCGSVLCLFVALISLSRHAFR